MKRALRLYAGVFASSSLFFSSEPDDFCVSLAENLRKGPWNKNLDLEHTGWVLSYAP